MDRNAHLLREMLYHRFHVRDLPARIKDQHTLPVSDIKPKDLISFPRFSKSAQKVIVEFQDCIIQALDLLDFQILVDDNKSRARALLDFEESQKQSLSLLKGNNISKDVNALRTYNNLFCAQGNVSPRAATESHTK
jgi:hypothetical protein